MNKINTVVYFFVLALFAGESLAQEESAAASYVYATYFVCAPDGESRADEIISSSFKPHYDAAVEHGDIQAWSWMQHYVGGNWRRVLVIVAKDINSLLDASGALGEIIGEKTPEAGRAFSAICSSHDDYIWKTVPEVGTAGISARRGAAGFSVYMRCDLNGEERADELVRTVFAPIYDKHVGEGALTSWNWLQHHVGGEWRRVLLMGAADHKALMKARDAIVADYQERKVKRAAEEMNKICDTHQDYMWDILEQAQ